MGPWLQYKIGRPSTQNQYQGSRGPSTQNQYQASRGPSTQNQYQASRGPSTQTSTRPVEGPVHKTSTRPVEGPVHKTSTRVQGWTTTGVGQGPWLQYKIGRPRLKNWWGRAHGLKHGVTKKQKEE